LVLVPAWCSSAFAAKITGSISDKRLGLPVNSASVTIPGFGARLSGPDGFFVFTKVPKGEYELLVSAVGYKSYSLFFSVDEHHRTPVLHILLEPVSSLLDTVNVTGSIDPGREVYGRMLERTSVPLMHIISRQSIERSSDITVADMLQRISGVSLLRNETGMPGKAIIRGMDPKYSYTAVNGMAVPSPDDKSRYLSLDLFPAGIIDHLEIYKTLTADMAGDGIGGRINIITRTIPKDKEFSVQLATGYSCIFFQRSYLAFSNSVVQTKSPYERYGPGHYATGSDFTKDNLSFYAKQPVPDIQGNISWSKRFIHERLGVMVAGGTQTIRSGSDGFLILQNNEPQIGNIPGITDFIKRQYSATSNRKNLYAALDYKINDRNHLRLYELYINKLDIESRSAVDTSLSEGRSGPGTGRIALMQRSRLHRQSMGHFNLQGDNRVSNEFSIDWSAVYSRAFGSYPDWAELTANTGRILGSNGTVNQTPLLLAPLTRTWLHNKETEKDLQANLHYKPAIL
jgi:hypothetical protein